MELKERSTAQEHVLDLCRVLAPGNRGPFMRTRFSEQQADRAHRRFLASVASLARVRKLITPIQINIAEQQVNVAGNLPPGRGGRNARA